MLEAVNPEKIFIMAGTNDLVHVSLEEYRRRYLLLISTIKESIPNATIYIESVLPIVSWGIMPQMRKLNKLMQSQKKFRIHTDVFI